MHIDIYYDNEDEQKLARELELALYYGTEFGSSLLNMLQNDVYIAVLDNGD